MLGDGAEKKIEFEYTKSFRASRRCTRCEHGKFEKTVYKCDVVKGNVSRQWTCSQFKEKKERDK
jgi:hypothetical protein